MKREKFYLGSPAKKENRKGAGEYSPLKYVRLVSGDEKYISGGGVGSVHSNMYEDLESGQKMMMAKKEFTHGFSKSDIERLFDIYNILESAEIPTLPIYTDGQNIYSPLLNTDDRLVLSANNETPKFSKEGREKFKYINIKNFDEFLENILSIVGKSIEAGIELSWDSLFYILNLENNNEPEFVVDIIVGDYDLLKKKKYTFEGNKTLEQLWENLSLFINKYIHPEESAEYFRTAEEILKPELHSNQVLTANGIKTISKLDKRDIVFKIPEDLKLLNDDEIALLFSVITADEKLRRKNIWLNEENNFSTNFNKEHKVIVGNLYEVQAEQFNNFSEDALLMGDLFSEVEKLDGESMPRIIEGSLSLSNLKKVVNIIFPNSISGWLEMQELEYMENAKLPKLVSGEFRLPFLEKMLNTIMPEEIQGNFDMSGLEITDNLVLPKIILGNVDLSSLREFESIILPEIIYGSLILESVEFLEDAIFPENIYGSLDLSSLKNYKNLFMPKMVQGYCDLSSLTTIDNINIPKYIKGDLYLNSLDSLENLRLNGFVGGDIYFGNEISNEELSEWKLKYPSYSIRRVH